MHLRMGAAVRESWVESASLCALRGLVIEVISTMKLFLSVCSLLLLAITGFTSEKAPEATNSDIALNARWKLEVFEFAKSNLQHSAWGVAHLERDYQLALMLATEENLAVDTDVLFAAAFLHDMGVFAPYPKEGVDHTERAAEVADQVLKAAGFPMEKFAWVQEVMRSHMFYSKVGATAEARVFHDADTLDFLGAIGVARIFSVTTRHRWAKTLPDAVATLEQFKRELPGKLVTDAAKKRAVERLKEMEQFIDALKAETDGGRVI